MPEPVDMSTPKESSSAGASPSQPASGVQQPSSGSAAQAPSTPASAAGAAPDAQTKTQPHVRPSAQPSDDASDTRTQLIRPPDVVHMEAGDRKLLKISCHKCLQKLDVTFLEPFSRFNCPSCEVELIVPKWFDNYLLEEPGGIGGMATVYRALDLALDREVAIKVLNPDVASKSDRADLFLHEARTAATINHYAVIPIYTCGVFEGQPYIIMQYMGGGSLEAKLKSSMGVLPIADVAKWIRDVAEGLDNANRHGITHHDVKPGNIMLDSDGNAKIGDFGLAQAVHDDRSKQIAELTKAWISPHYVSPEKIRDGKEDFLGDVYSLGAAFYHLSTGFTPFSSPDVDELIKLRLNGDPQAPHQLRSDLPVNLSRLILAMMDREPDKRPHYRDIVKSLNEYLKSVDAKGKPASKGPKLRATTINQERIQSAVQEKLGEGSSASVSKIPLAAGAAIALLLLLLGCVCFYGFSSGKLQAWLPFLKSGNAKLLKDDVDRAPKIAALFAAGDAAGALEEAKSVFSDVSAPTDARVQAAVQLALANYLVKDSKAKENCAFIAERLDAIRTAANPSGEMTMGDPPAKAIVSFLANYENAPSELKERVSIAPQSLRLASSLAIFLRAAKAKAPKEMVLSTFSDFRNEEMAAPKSLWGGAWQGRLEIWGEVLDGMQPEPGAALEPLVADLPKQLGVKSQGKAKAKAAKLAPKPVQFVEDVAPQAVHAASSSSSSVQDDPAGKALNAVLSKFDETSILAKLSQQHPGRPHPLGLRFNEESLQAYLAGVAEPLRDSETARAKVMLSCRDRVEKALLKIPYETSDFETDSASLGKGTLFVDGQSLVFRNAAGQRTSILWENVPPKQWAAMASYYGEVFESAAKKRGADAQLKAACAREILRAAVMAGWYGDSKVASENARRALRLDPGLEQEASRLLLK